MTFCSDMVPSLERALAPPGQFEALFPGATEEELSLTIADSFAFIQLFGMLEKWTLDSVTLDISPDLPLPEQQAVVTVAAMRTVRTQLRNVKNKVLYEAGPTRYQSETSASMLTAELELLEKLWEELKDALGGIDAYATAVGVYDNYHERMVAEFSERYPVGV